MPSYTTTVQDVLDAAIQDSQVQTTNRPTLLNYLNRVNMRVLRESQWIFLKSPEQRFTTRRGVTKYWINNGKSPSDCVDTGLQISNLNSILPETVFDLTNNRQLLQNSESIQVFAGLHSLDGTFRESLPRSFRYNYDEPGIFHVLPPPQNGNLYQPVPLPCGLSTIQGGSLAVQNLYVHTTIVDSQGGESTVASDFSHIIVPKGFQLVVNPPDLVGISGTDVDYSSYNVYISTSPHGPYTLQNASPISRSLAWTPLEGFEPGGGGLASVTLQAQSGEFFQLSVNPDGSWHTESIGYAGTVDFLSVSDTLNNSWMLQVANDGTLQTLETVNDPVTSLVLADSNATNWLITANVDGSLNSRVVTIPSVPVQPPTTSTVSPLYGYIIVFHYQQKRLPLVLMTDVLQIPDEYIDVVQAGLNYYVNMYTSKDQDVTMKASIWKKEFMDGLAQMRRDLRINNRNADFLSPDRSSQKNQGIDWNIALYN